MVLGFNPVLQITMTHLASWSKSVSTLFLILKNTIANNEPICLL